MAAPSSDDVVTRASRHVKTWTRHCQSLRSMAEQRRDEDLRGACGVCAVVAVEQLYDTTTYRAAASAPELVRMVGANADVRAGAEALMAYAKWGFHISSSADGGRSAKITGDAEAAGTAGLLRFAMGMFDKAVAWEGKLAEVGGDDAKVLGTLRRLYFEVSELFGVVLWMMERKRFEGVGGGVKEKQRYAMWRATALFKAEKAGANVRDVCVARGNVGGDEEEDADEPAAPATDRGRNQTTEVEKAQLRPARAFAVGDVVWYSAALRGSARVKATVTLVGRDHVEGVAVYDLVEENGGVERRGVRGETCAPRVEVGDCVVVGGEDGEGGEGGEAYESGLVEEVYYSSWPPTYLCMVAGGLEEVEDVCLYFDEGEEGEEQEEEQEDDDAEVDERARFAEAEKVNVQEETVEEEVKEEVKEEIPSPPPSPPRPSPPRPSPPQPSPPLRPPPPSTLINDDIVSMTKAEKLAKSAISCISFGDAPSAVRLLKEALITLTGTAE